MSSRIHGAFSSASYRMGSIVHECGQSYNEVFAHTSFQGEPSYESFMHFLRILAADGVEKAWFDALCINQKETGEKDREICYMGAYYALSQGCYVSSHGIGVDYHALDCSTGDVPRWFTRVWTIQECILPKKLTFIVQKFDSATVEALEELSGGVREYAGRLADRNARSIQAGELDFVTPLGSKGIEFDVYFQRRVENHGGEEELYYLDSDDYARVLWYQYLVWAKVGGKSMSAVFERIREISLSLNQRNMAKLGGYECLALEEWASSSSSSSSSAAVILRSVGGLEGYCLARKEWASSSSASEKPTSSSGIQPILPIEHLAAQAMGRHCSVEEDRILSILGLLGMRGDLQLRTGKDLQAQFLSVARIFNDQSPRGLLNLCAIDCSNNGLPNMSWAPDLRHVADHQLESSHADGSSRNVLLMNALVHFVLYVRFYAADVLGMDRVGRITLLAKACQGCLMAVQNREYWMEVNGVRLPSATGGRVSCNIFELRFENTQTPSHQGRLIYRDMSELLQDNDGLAFCHIYLSGTGVHVLSDVHAADPIIICNIWLVLLGYTDDSDGNGKGPLQVLLVCVRAPGETEELHKIGTMFLLESAYIDFSSSVFTKWILGGFGPDLSSFLNLGATTG